MRIFTRSAGALAIVSALTAALALPAEARPGRYGYGYTGRGPAWHGYAYRRSSPYGYAGYERAYRRGYYGYGAYPGYYHYRTHDDDAVIAIGAGLLGIMLGTAIASRSRSRDSGRDDYYDEDRYRDEYYDEGSDRHYGPGFRGRYDRQYGRRHDPDDNWDYAEDAEEPPAATRDSETYRYYSRRENNPDPGESGGDLAEDIPEQSAVPADVVGM